ncbi:trypsin-like peptidase domain-containing protein [Streptomyces sp. t39]|uniref:trypsin-like peptidase domain-containing protein n=1 Tax=Streptomyces sp. t39 TaxID=1828156 RepID=UPI0011CDA699|nr:trypsin-like peptidase domain-containing protein [Streptomyces sp. t39]TXS52789.1 serine protease [Streptomyces sp. t39]
MEDQLACTVWITAEDEFCGSGFLTSAGTVTTAAHVLVGDGTLRDLVIHHASGTYPVNSRDVRAEPKNSDGGLFYPFPDLATVHVPALSDYPVLPLAQSEAPIGSEVTCLGYSSSVLGIDEVQPETLLLRVAGVSGPFRRFLGDGVRPGHSGAAVLGQDGAVCGVLKGSRNYKDDAGGWFVPVTTLAQFLGVQPRAAAVRRQEPTQAEVVDALLAFGVLAGPEARFDLLEIMGKHLRLPQSFDADYRPDRRGHLQRIVSRIGSFYDRSGAYRALYTAMEELNPYDQALKRLHEVIGRAIGGWESA